MTNKPMKYRLILADPPWRCANRGVNGAAEKHYPTMTPGQIKALPVKALAARDAVLVLWATWPMLEGALRVIPAWGFRYKTGFPWIELVGDAEELRPSWGPGWWARGCSEAVLIGVRGRASPPEADWLGLLSKRLKHSKKPEDVYTYCESFPGPYLELFAREQRSVWDVWGNEVMGIDLEEAADEAELRSEEENEGNGEWARLDGIWFMWCGKHRVRIEYVRLEDVARFHRVVDRSEAERIGEAAAGSGAGLYAEGERRCDIK